MQYSLTVFRKVDSKTRNYARVYVRGQMDHDGRFLEKPKQIGILKTLRREDIGYGAATDSI